MAPEVILRIIIVLIGFFVFIILAASRKAKKVAQQSGESKNNNATSMLDFFDINKSDENKKIDKDYYKYGNYDEYDDKDNYSGIDNLKQSLFDKYKIEQEKALKSSDKNIRLAAENSKKLRETKKTTKSTNEVNLDNNISEIELDFSDKNIINAILFNEIFERRGIRKTNFRK